MSVSRLLPKRLVTLFLSHCKAQPSKLVVSQIKENRFAHLQKYSLLLPPATPLSPRSTLSPYITEATLIPAPKCDSLRSVPSSASFSPILCHPYSPASLHPIFGDGIQGKRPFSLTSLPPTLFFAIPRHYIYLRTALFCVRQTIKIFTLPTINLRNLDTSSQSALKKENVK
jgi:hypothetical protein